MGLRSRSFQGPGDDISQWRDVDDRPVLWDLWTDESKSFSAGWKYIMPLSVTVSDLPTPSPYPEQPRRPVALGYRDALRTRFHMQKKRVKDHPAKPQVQVTVAVAIALPFPRRSRAAEPLGGDSGADYSIGLFNVPLQDSWR